jgi:hypothetical protein
MTIDPKIHDALFDAFKKAIDGVKVHVDFDKMAQLSIREGAVVADVNGEKVTLAFINAQKAKMTECPHANIQCNPMRPKRGNGTYRGLEGWEGAVCADCDKGFGWFCPQSPDHACHYFSEKGENVNGRPAVRLHTGELVAVPDKFYEGWTSHDGVTVSSKTEPYTFEDQAHETDDCCLFCNDPEERK